MSTTLGQAGALMSGGGLVGRAGCRATKLRNRPCMATWSTQVGSSGQALYACMRGHRLFGWDQVMHAWPQVVRMGGQVMHAWPQVVWAHES